jgi:hypothetical protein
METNIEDNVHKLRLRLIDSVSSQCLALSLEIRIHIFRNLIINVVVRMNISNEHVSFLNQNIMLID